jgi:aminoglycoside phosphotransferase (APT) family kinase protein
MGTKPALAVGLLRELRRHFADDVALTEAPAPLSGGFSAELYAFAIDRDPHRLVLRIPADQRSTREAAIQAYVSNLGYRAPRVLFAGDEHSALGRSFLVMTRRPGRTPLDAASVLGLPKLFRDIPVTLAQMMVELHELPVGALPADTTDRMLADLGPGEIRHRLEAERPPTSADVICHGDLHGANLLVDAGEVTAVLDWELAGVGPAELDVARTALILALLPGIARSAQRLLAPLGRRTARRFVEAYAARRPLDDDALAWFDMLHAARLLVVARGSGPVAEQWRPLVPALCARVDAGARSD